MRVINVSVETDRSETDMTGLSERARRRALNRETPDLTSMCLRPSEPAVACTTIRVSRHRVMYGVICMPMITHS